MHKLNQILTVAIPFVSGAGHTRLLAEQIALGVDAVDDCKAVLIDVEALSESDWSLMSDCAAMVLATPTYMGGPAAAFKAFMDESSTQWERRDWQDKLAAGATVGVFPSGDKLSTLSQLSVFAAQHGMIWIGSSDVGAPVTEKPINPAGIWLGVSVTETKLNGALLNEIDTATARSFGVRVAEATRRWAGPTIDGQETRT